MLNSEFNEAFKQWENDEITKREVYERIKDIQEIPDRVKDNWNPDTEV